MSRSEKTLTSSYVSSALSRLSPLAFTSCALLILASFVVTGCRCVNCDDEEEMQNIEIDEPWSLLEAVRPRTTILTIGSNDAQILLFTEDEFLAVGADGEVVQRRPYRREFRSLGRPAVREIVYARGAEDLRDGAEIIEFNLVQPGGDQFSFAIDSLDDRPQSLYRDAVTIGTFNDFGTVYVQPVLNRETRELELLFFELEPGVTLTDFEAVEFLGTVELPGIREIQGAISSIEFIDGAFLIASKFGGYRVTEGGVVSEVIDSPTDLRDFFVYRGQVYASQVTNGVLFTSRDGSAFERTGLVQDVRLAKAFGEQLVSQELPGWNYRITSNLGETTEPLLLNSDFPVGENDDYFGLVKLDTLFYLGVGNRLYTSPELEADPE